MSTLRRLPGFAAAAAVAAVVCAALPAFSQTITVQSDKPDGIYKVGEKIVWHLTVTGDGAADVTKISYVLKKGQAVDAGKGELTLTNGAADLETSMSEPGSMFAQLTATGAAGKPIKELAGALVAPGEIKPSLPRPADFDDFWKSKVEELHKVPMNPVLTPGDSGNPKVDFYKITMDNIRGTHIQGQLTRPKTGKKFPALLQVQYAGVYPLDKPNAIRSGASGWLFLNIMAHDLPIDESKEFYTQGVAGSLVNKYPYIGNDDREASYFLRMYLSCYRAIDYLRTRDDWDGKVLVVTGGSQGGLQTLMIGGLYPAGTITALVANVPAGCDMSGPAVGRRPGWPQWWYAAAGKDAAKVHEASRYYDVVNFASHITAPTLVGTGLIDQTCPCAGVCAAFNQIAAPKELVVMPRSEHKETNHSQAPFYTRQNAWFAALGKGNPPPVMAR